MLSQLFKNITAAICFVCLIHTASAQHGGHEGKKYDNLYSAGYASAFIAGLYDVYFPYKQVLQHGDFGLGAPEHLDGELLIYKGVPYQTRYTGKTTVASGTAPYAISCFFKTDKILKPGRPLSKTEFYKYIDSVTTINGMYAIHITGKFNYIKTRAFPPMEKPYKPLAQLLDKQVFFENKDIDGDLVGFKLPAFMDGPYIAGYHFHFLAADKQKGGHIIDFTAHDITIEIDELKSFSMDLQQTPEFKDFDFKQDRSADIKSVEMGAKKQ
ncbi:MAG: acetolactate decarboxylase [Sphingobacteriaceae bacterium]|nr:MAG: acetolactate decarboxylase [Sphingobacteriaceae bacterium]